MRFIHLFIASSIIEFERERVYIGDHIRRLNDRSYDEGYYVKLYLCEDDSENLQSTYDRKIENCDIFLALIGEKLGEKTKHELYVAHCSNGIISRHIIINNECDQSIIPQELLSSFEINVTESFQLEALFQHIDSCIHSIVSQINDTDFSPARKLFNLNIPSLNDSYELAIISNIIRGLKDRFEDELQLTTSYSFAEVYNAYLSLLSENQDFEYERLFRISNDENLRNSLWLFENEQFAADRSESIKKVISNLYEYGNYHITYQSTEQLQLSFYRKLVDALNSFKSFIEVKYIIINHILYEESQRTHKRKVVKNLFSNTLDHQKQRYIEQNIVNITNLYIITDQVDKLKEALLKLEESDYEHFIFNPDIISPDLPFTEYYKTSVEYIFNSIEYLNYNTCNYTGDEIKNKLDHILHAIVERDILLKPTDQLKTYYLCGKLLMSYNDKYTIAKQYYIKAYNAYNDGAINEDIYTNYIKDIIVDICEICFDYNDNEQILTWVDKGKKFLDTDDIAYKVRLLVYEARGSRDYNPLLSEKLYNSAISILTERNLFKEVDDLLDLYIIVSFEIIFDKYRSIPDSDAGQIQLFNDQTLALDELHQRYLNNNNFWHSKVYILYMLGLLNLDMQFCIKGDNILNSHHDERINHERVYDLEYIKALIHKKKHEYQESNRILLNLAQLYKGQMSKASCYQIIGTNYSYMYNSMDESLNLAKTYYKKALELDPKLGGKIYDGLSYCCLMTKDFKEAEEYARKALLEENLFNDNKYANYITSLLCQKKYIKAFITYAIKCKRKQSIKNILRNDWDTDLRSLGIDTSHFHAIFILDKTTQP